MVRTMYDYWVRSLLFVLALSPLYFETIFFKNLFFHFRVFSGPKRPAKFRFTLAFAHHPLRAFGPPAPGVCLFAFRSHTTPNFSVAIVIAFEVFLYFSCCVFLGVLSTIRHFVCHSCWGLV